MSAVSTTRARYAAASHPGRVRANNEDALDYDASLGIAVLADGMGGTNAGEVASATAVAEVMRYLRAESGALTNEPGAALMDAVTRANRAVYRKSLTRPEYEGMGTTLIAAALDDTDMIVAHVGDSRAYCHDGRMLTRVTTDHSLVQSLVDTGVLTADQARRAPNRNIVTRAIGLQHEVRCELSRVPLVAGAIGLLCSDGLTDMLDDHEIGAACARRQDPDQLVATLVDAALRAGGYDNVSIIAFERRSEAG